MKFAQKKEIRDRLKEFDAPNAADYIDPDTIDKIMASHKTPIIKKGGKKKEKKTDEEVLKENKERIRKMKELYGMFVAVQNEQEEER